MIILSISIIIFILLSVIVIRALTFNPKPEKLNVVEIPNFDKARPITNLQHLIKCKTISYNDKSLEDESEFIKLEKLLTSLYPNVNKACEKIELGNRNILFRWKGKSQESPTVLMSHYDVVPVEETYWIKPPFDAVIEHDILWGRGTLDTKGTLNGILEAVDILISQNFIPKNDIYLAFGGDEETNGNGQIEIIEYMKNHNIKPALVVDEGGAVVENVFPGVDKPAAVIGMSEKGLLNVCFEAKSNGGHASAPPAVTPITELAQAINKVQKGPFKTQLTPPVKAMFDTLGRHSSFGYKLLFANLWIFRPLLDYMCTKRGGELNALMRTSLVFTKMQGSKANNVIPPVASVSANLRLLGDDSIDKSIKYLESVIKNENISVTKINGNEPCTSSKLDCKQWDIVKDAVHGTWPEAIISPYLMIACSDSRHYASICDYVYRFSAMELSKEERNSIHGHDEKVPTDKIIKVVEFYLRLIQTI